MTRQARNLRVKAKQARNVPNYFWCRLQNNIRGFWLNVKRVSRISMRLTHALGASG
jgi:hypothetical protein